MRLRDVLRRVMGVSYTAMKSAKWNGGITVDGVVTPVDAFVRVGQVVAIRFRENAPVYAVKPYELPLNIACEDDPESRNSRVDQLLRTLQVADPTHPDFSVVDAQLAIQRQRGLDFLQSAISQAVSQATPAKAR